MHVFVAASGVLGVLVSMTMVSFLFSAQAAGFTSFSDTLSTLRAGAYANHEIKAIIANGVSAGGTLAVDFEGREGSPFALGNVDKADVDFAISGSDCDGTFTEMTLADAPSGAAWGVQFEAGKTTMNFVSDTGTVPAGKCVRIRVGTNAVGGVHQIMNPTLPNTNTKPARLRLTVGLDTDRVGIGIIADDRVMVSTTVPMYLTFTTSTTSCSFGNLASDALKVCAYDAIVSTNNVSGYTLTMADPTEPTTLVNADGVTVIPDVSGTMDIGVSEYGVSGSDSGGAVGIAFQSAAGCANGNPGLNTSATPITSLEQVLSDNNTMGQEVTTVCHKATITADQRSGAYTNNVTLTATANP